jgi:subtilase family serine protease
VALSGLPAKAATGQTVQGNTPKYVSTATVLGREDASKIVEVSLWLHPHNRGELDELAKDLYEPKSPQYRHWLKQADIAAKFAPTAAEVKTVGQFLESHNLKVIGVGAHNFFVRARGTVGDVETAFHVTLFNYDVNGKTIRANSNDPYIEGAAAPLVRHVSGLDSSEFTHPIASRPTSFSHGPKAAANVAAVADGDANFYESECFTGTKTENYTTGGTFPTASYSGNNYFSSQTGPGCGYTPTEVQTAYHLTSLYKEGFDGTGQTIVIIDWCGSPTIRTTPTSSPRSSVCRS